MAAPIVKKYSINIRGILAVIEDSIGIEVTETGEYIALDELLEDFIDKSVKISVAYDEEYNAE